MSRPPTTASSNRLNVIGMVPYVWTRGQPGRPPRDPRLPGPDARGEMELGREARHGGRRVAGRRGPVRGNSSHGLQPELLPFRSAMGSTRVSWRGTVNFQSNPGWYLNGSTAFTWRPEVGLDRPYFFTDDEFVMSDEVDMPNVFDYVVSAGYMKNGLMTAVSFSQQRTFGGGDNRRQDMPFLSNRMDFFRAGAMVMYPIPKLERWHSRSRWPIRLMAGTWGRAPHTRPVLLYTFNAGGATR